MVRPQAFAEEVKVTLPYVTKPEKAAGSGLWLMEIAIWLMEIAIWLMEIAICEEGTADKDLSNGMRAFGGRWLVAGSARGCGWFRALTHAAESFGVEKLDAAPGDWASERREVSLVPTATLLAVAAC
jgi:hypothetical protein